MLTASAAAIQAGVHCERTMAAISPKSMLVKSTQHSPALTMTGMAKPAMRPMVIFWCVSLMIVQKYIKSTKYVWHGWKNA